MLESPFNKRDFNTGVSCEYREIFRSSFLYRTTLVAASGDVSKTVKPDGMILSVKIECLNPVSVNAAMLK